MVLAQKYINPEESREWVVVKQPYSSGREPYIIHRSIDSFADTRWFYEVAPQLFEYANDPAIAVFSRKFGYK
jgi:hypothetical protein